MHWRPLRDRFYERVDKQPDGCWHWIGRLSKSGCGQISADGKSQLAHRVSANLHGKPVEHWQIVSRTCDVKHCVNPEHLVVGTRKEIWRPKQARVYTRVPGPDGRLIKTALPVKQAAAVLKARAAKAKQADRMKTCVWCKRKVKRELMPKRRQKTCSRDCWLALYRSKRPETMAKQNIVCKRRGCEALVPYRPQKKAPKFCSEQCRKLIVGRHLRRVRPKKSPLWVIASCVVCRNWFARKRRDRVDTCGKLCKTKLVCKHRQLQICKTKQWTRPDSAIALCVMCGAKFKQSPHPKFTCSPTCANKLNAASQREKNAKRRSLAKA